MISPEDVRAKIGIYSDEHVAAFWRVSPRTVRRWKRTGLPLYYGNLNIRPEDWHAWIPSTRGTGVDRQVSGQPSRSRNLSGSSSGRKVSGR